MSLKLHCVLGVGNSIVDNSHSGGQAYEVDIETGYVVSPSWSHNSPDLLIHPGYRYFYVGSIDSLLGGGEESLL